MQCPILPSLMARMKLVVGFTVVLFSTSALSDTLTKDQSDAVVDGLKESTRSLLRACLSSESFASCAENSGIDCEKFSEGADQDYRCTTRAKIEYAVHESAPPGISEVWEVTFRVFFSGKRWNIGPVTISRVVE